MDDSARVQSCGTRFGLTEFLKQEGESSLEEVHSASFSSSSSSSSVLDAPVPAPLDEATKEVKEQEGGGTEQGPRSTEQEEALAGEEEARREWVTTLQTGSMLDACNKHGVWFEVSGRQTPPLYSSPPFSTACDVVSCSKYHSSLLPSALSAWSAWSALM